MRTLLYIEFRASIIDFFLCFSFVLYVPKVCDWLYPLTPDIPVLLANSGIYMFPDSLAETPGSFVGIVLSSELPATDQDAFKDLLNQLTDFRVQVKRVQCVTTCCLNRSLCHSAAAQRHSCTLSVVYVSQHFRKSENILSQLSHGLQECVCVSIE